MRGDTTTGLVLQGEAEWVIAWLNKVLDLPMEQASRTIEVFCEQELGCEPGTVPAGPFDYAIRLCRECANGTPAIVGIISAGALPCYGQPAGEGA
jgi:hypothetical protein